MSHFGKPLKTNLRFIVFSPTPRELSNDLDLVTDHFIALTLL